MDFEYTELGTAFLRHLPPKSRAAKREDFFYDNLTIKNFPFMMYSEIEDRFECYRQNSDELNNDLEYAIEIGYVFLFAEEHLY